MNQNRRGQAFIIGGILMSILIIGTAVSLNLFLFTESSTEPVSGESSVDTISHINTLEQSQKELLDQLNRQQYEQRTTMDTELTNSMDTIYEAEQDRLYSKGIQYQSSLDPTYGVLIEQPTRGYDSPADTTNWDLLSSDEKLTDASFTFETGSLPTSRTGQTTLVFENSSGTYEYIPTYESSSNTFILYQNPGVVFSEVCTINTSESTVKIDFRENTVNGEDCSELGDVSMNQDHSVSIENGQETTTGSFVLLYEGPNSSRGSTIGTNSSTTNYAEKVLQIYSDGEMIYREGTGSVTPTTDISREEYNSRGDYFDT